MIPTMTGDGVDFLLFFIFFYFVFRGEGGGDICQILSSCLC